MTGRCNSIFGTSGFSRALVALLLLGGATDVLAGRNFYVDYAGGDDAADGQSPETAWKHAPGGWGSSGQAKATKLAPGDRVLFKGGVRYRGQIDIKSSGTAEAPIVYDGSSWGSKRAIIDGSKATGTPQPCPSQAACLGSEHWRNLKMVTIPTDTRWSDWLFVNDDALQVAQWPDISNYWDYDNVDKMATVPAAKLPELKAGFIAVPGVPMQLMAGSPVLGQWYTSNDIAFAKSFEITPEGVNFDHPGYSPYSGRDNKFVIYNAPSQVNAPGKFAISGKDGVAIYWPTLSTQRRSMPGVGVGTRRMGFEILHNVRHVRIRGFSFANFASPQFGASTADGEGVPVRAKLSPWNLTIEDNAFRSIVNMTRAGAIRVIRGGEIDVRRNQFEHLPWASAIYISHNDGPVRAKCNTIRNIGRNGVRILSAKHSEVIGNRMEGLNNIHGAGINLYLDNRYAMVRGNVITDSERPLTMHGTNTPWFDTPEPVDLNIVDNVMNSNDWNSASISSWGKNLHNVKIQDNFLGSVRFAMRFSRDERNIVYANNQLVGGIAKPASTELIDGGGNVTMATDGNGQLAMQEAALTSVDQEACGSPLVEMKPLMSSMRMVR